MSPRRVPVDWDGLEMGLTWHHLDGAGCVLDLTTGEVIGPNDEDADEEALDDGIAAGRMVYIEPLPSSVEYGWMAEFADAVESARLRELLDVALRGSGAFRRFKDVLAGHPAERERWFAFRAERLVEAMRDWLEENDIEPTTQPRRRP